MYTLTSADPAKLKEYAHNLEVTITAVTNFSEERVYLDAFRKDSNCGTCYCVSGLIAVTPYFNEKYNVIADPEDGEAIIRTGYDGDTSMEKTLFGYIGLYKPDHPYPYVGVFSILFTAYGMGEWDEELNHSAECTLHRRLTHKELALARLNKALGILKACL
jgi:hypothetical protein